MFFTPTLVIEFVGFLEVNVDCLTLNADGLKTAFTGGDVAGLFASAMEAALVCGVCIWLSAAVLEFVDLLPAFAALFCMLAEKQKD